MTPVFRQHSSSATRLPGTQSTFRPPFARSRWVVLPGGRFSATVLALGLAILWPGIGRGNLGPVMQNPLEMTELHLPVDARGTILDIQTQNNVGWVLVRTGSGFAVVRFAPQSATPETTVSYPWATPLEILHGAIAENGTVWIIGQEPGGEPMGNFVVLRLSDGKITSNKLTPELQPKKKSGTEDEGRMMAITTIFAHPDSLWLGGWVGVHSDQTAYTAWYGQIDATLRWVRGSTVDLKSVGGTDKEKVAPYESAVTAIFSEKNDTIAVGYARMSEAETERVWSLAITTKGARPKPIGTSPAGPPSPIQWADPGIGTATIFVPSTDPTHITRVDWAPLDPKGTPRKGDISAQSSLDTTEWPLLSVGLAADTTHLWIGGDEPAWISVAADGTTQRYPAPFLKPYRSTRAVVATPEGFWLAMEPVAHDVPPLTDVLLRVRLNTKPTKTE